jgi:hypothetical protein
MRSFLILFILIVSTKSFGLNDRYFARSPKALLMGDAFTSIADDEYTLYYNPAILARHKGLSFWAINPQITVTNVLTADNIFDNTGNSTADFVDNFMGTPIHIGLNASPGFKLGRFGFTAVVNNQTNMNVVNRYTPMLDIDHHYDRGFIAGYGFPLNGDLAFGMSVKYIQRESIFGTYNLLSSTTIDLIDQISNAQSASEYSDILASAFGKAEGSAWGVDFGLDYVKRKGDNLFTMGFSLLDAYTKFNTTSSPNQSSVQAQPLKANFGASYLIKKSGFGMLFSGDLRNLEDFELDFTKRLRLGTEFMFTPVLSVLAGLNSGEYSYGIKLDLGALQTYVGVYGVDIGERADQQSSQRAVIYISLFDFNFDV